MKPDFSPEMLRFFLHARYRHSGSEAPAAKALNWLRKAAGVDVYDMRAAIAGHLTRAKPRVRLWGALGHVVADHGITLTDDGGQR